jgi:large subunit ribosomal protein L31e
MAEKKLVGRVYNIPLRREILKVPTYKRAKKAITAIRQFLERHLKTDEVRIGKYLNHKILEHGRKNVPHHVEVEIRSSKKKVKDKEVEILTAELIGAPVEEVIEEKKGKLEKVKEKIMGKKEEEKKEKDDIIKEKSKDLERKKSKQPRVLKEERADKGADAENILKERVTKSQKPSHERKK